ncbi:NAD-dependent succinate-semialdehyde dehydrogenase [Rhodococcoides yunnanense]|uniref:NAD-dependent succinate-semialdehyde dehydrogenase n=1 Tax=Rhodococcoides yunnanense TaxID=278209 RepID=A0ABU4B6Y8_9NOCA|nr:NAD-dependent succinate-semialdehyde dehydrogenase [Rhodococcus yunnanensis]MDV6259928.1 NAD-dependent succinate-semialdehyde dehydrogenase [Rhodococcus yunnanensis]
MSYASTNPFTNRTVATFRDITDHELDNVVVQAQSTFESWKNVPFAERTHVMKRAAVLLRDNAREYAHLLTLEMGKLFSESLGEVELSASILEYYADNAETFLAPRTLPSAPGETGNAVVHSEPLGILLGIQPWNFPYYQLARVAGPNLMAGNVVIVKHASIVPQSAAAFEKLFLDAGAPKGLYSNVYATKEQISSLIDDPRVRGVALTGSEQAGAIVAARAGKNLKKSTMELGGTDALIVLADADIDKTVQWALWGRMNNGGQCCVASKRIIVEESVADEFTAKFLDAMAGLNAGDPLLVTTTLPPMSSQSAADNLRAQSKIAREHGAIVTEVGAPVPSSGAFMQPTVITEVSSDNPVYDMEFFGPVALIFRAADAEDAVRIANDSSYGLGGSIFTADIERGQALAQRIDTGMVFVNHPTWTRADLPFGGVKKSGYGHELSSSGIEEFVNKKLINTVPIDAPA